MRHGNKRINSICHFIGRLLELNGAILLLPLVAVWIYWGKRGDGSQTLIAFLVPALVSFSLGFVLRQISTPERLDMAGSMLSCALGWLLVSGAGALPFTIGIGSTYLNGYFEAMSGFTTTGITVYAGLDRMPRSILFWAGPHAMVRRNRHPLLLPGCDFQRRRRTPPVRRGKPQDLFRQACPGTVPHGANSVGDLWTLHRARQEPRRAAHSGASA